MPIAPGGPGPTCESSFCRLVSGVPRQFPPSLRSHLYNRNGHACSVFISQGLLWGLVAVMDVEEPRNLEGTIQMIIEMLRSVMSSFIQPE